MTTTPEWAVCVCPPMLATAGSMRGVVPLKAGDGWMPDLVAVDGEGRAVYSDPDEALSLIKRLSRMHPGEPFMLLAWWEKREAAVRAADAADTADRVRAVRRAEEDAIDRAEDLARDESTWDKPMKVTETVVRRMGGGRE